VRDGTPNPQGYESRASLERLLLEGIASGESAVVDDDYWVRFRARLRGPASIEREASMRQVMPHPLWIGHAGDGRDFPKLHEAGIRALVQLAIEEPAIQPPRDLLYFRVPISDGAGNRGDSLAVAIRAVAELVSRRVPTLVFCGAGMNRSPCIVAAALAVTFQEPPEKSLGMVMNQGPCDISPGLWAEVSDLMRCWQSDASAPDHSP
jgi:hypothetical protein